MKLNKYQKIILSFALISFIFPWLNETIYSGPGHGRGGVVIPGHINWSIIIHWFTLTVVTFWFIYLSIKPRKYLIALYLIFIFLYLMRIIEGPLGLVF